MAHSAAAACLYKPSAFENLWYEKPRHGTICMTAVTQFKFTGAWVDYAVNVAPRPPADKLQQHVMSHYLCADGRREFIEPLTGWARHPWADICYPRITTRKPNISIANTSYLVQRSFCDLSQHAVTAGRPRSLLFDVGCGGAPIGRRGSPVSSIPLFAELFRPSCVDFDLIYAWEKAPQDMPRWWGGIPAELHDRITFRNVAVVEEPAVVAPAATATPATPAASATPAGAQQPAAADASRRALRSARAGASVLQTLRGVARPSDFVVLKLDIDYSPVELSIVRAIIADPSLAALVDELYFEYHFRFDSHTLLQSLWTGSGGNETVDNALALMHALRERGVRAHFWV